MLNIEGKPVWSVTAVHPPWTWWPELFPDLCRIAIGAPGWDVESLEVGHPAPDGDYEGYPKCGNGFRRSLTHHQPFYVCPGHHRPKGQRYCGTEADFYCKSWGCETSGTVSWKPTSQTDWIILTANYSLYEGVLDNYNVPTCYRGWCLPLKIQFTKAGKEQSTAWIRGAKWGLRIYVDGADPGLLFTVRLKIESPPAQPVGPNKVLSEQRPIAPAVQGALPRLPKLRPPTERPTETSSTTLTLPVPSTGQRLLNLIQGAFKVLNGTRPNMTESCWLCLSSGPPYYEGIATMGTFNSTTSHNACTWDSKKKLTLTEVSGQGVCLGNPPAGYKHLCNQTLKSPKTVVNNYLVPEIDKWWACGSGLTPCISTSVFDETTDYCVLIQLVPRVYYHPADTLEHEAELRPGRLRREPISLTLAVILGLGVAAGVGTGTAALIQTPHYFHELRTAIDVDLRALEQSVSKLEESLTSLSEVVLQNRRGLDLLFLREGGLCASLKEECCFYADHSGVIRDSMSKLRERLDQRQRDREAQQNWFENWFNRSPWMTTLISSVAGPLIILLLLFTVGPCILNRLIAFIRERVSAVQLLVLRQRFEPLGEESDEEAYV